MSQRQKIAHKDKFKVEEVARIFGYTYDNILYLIRRGKLPAEKKNGTVGRQGYTYYLDRIETLKYYYENLYEKEGNIKEYTKADAERMLKIEQMLKLQRERKIAEKKLIPYEDVYRDIVDIFGTLLPAIRDAVDVFFMEHSLDKRFIAPLQRKIEAVLKDVLENLKAACTEE